MRSAAFDALDHAVPATSSPTRAPARRWDPDLPAQHFTMGFEDRFVGIIEKRLDNVPWDDLVQHRVRYFK